MKIDQAKTRRVENEMSSRPTFVKRSSSFNEKSRSEIVYLPVAKLKPFRYQGRRVFSEEDLGGLADTIREHGIRQPLTVLRVETEETSFEVVSGERRLRAAKMVELTTVPCIVIDDLRKAEEIALIENVQRQDLHPIELARALQSLVDDRGWGGQSDVAKKLGLSRSQVSELFKLNDLSLDVQELMLSQSFQSRDHMRKLFSFDNDEQKKAFILSSKSLDVSKKSMILSTRNQSVLRVSLSDGQFKIQKSLLKTLNQLQREELGFLLADLLNEIKGD